MRSLGAMLRNPAAGRGGFGGRGGGPSRSQGTNQGLRQSINFNYNWSNSASDIVNFNPGAGRQVRLYLRPPAGRLHYRSITE